MTREEAIKMLTAKAECMKRDISGFDEDCNSHRCGECNLCYEQGNMGEQVEYLQMAIKALEEPQWIPVAERLPEEFGDYLVSIKRIGWNCEEYVENDIAYWDDLEGFHKADKVIAWMPLPEPWKGEGNERA